MEAIILAGGLGTRLRSVISDVPKPMATVGGRPFLSFILDQFCAHVDKFILSVGYKSELIIDYYGSEYNGRELCYSIENEPLGTGGAILNALNLTTENTTMVINGDTFFDVNIAELLSCHSKTNVDITLSLKPMKNFDRYGSVIVDDYKINNFQEKKYTEKGLINGGIYVINKDKLYNKKLPQKFSFETDLLQKYVKEIELGSFISEGYFIDIGIPEDYAKAQSEMIK